MNDQRYDNPEEVVGDSQATSESDHKPTFLERYKNFPWWVKYGPLIAVVALFLMPRPTVVELGSIQIGSQVFLVGGLIAVLFSTVAYRYAEHRSTFIHDHAHSIFYAGLALIGVAILVTYAVPAPPLELDPSGETGLLNIIFGA